MPLPIYSVTFRMARHPHATLTMEVEAHDADEAQDNADRLLAYGFDVVEVERVPEPCGDCRQTASHLAGCHAV